MIFPHRYYLFAPAEALPTLRAMVSQLWPCPPDHCEAAFDTPFSLASDPAGPVVYYAGSTIASEEHRQSLSAAEGGLTDAGIFYCRCDNADSEIVRASNHPWGQTRVGLHFDLAFTLKNLGLAFHRVSGSVP